MTHHSKDRREDILVSVCLGDIPATDSVFAKVAELAQALDQRFRFREIVLVAKASGHEVYTPLIRTVPNLRLILVRDELSVYTERVIAASEAIGDVVLVVSTEDLGSALVAMIEMAADQAQIVVSEHPEPRRLNRVMSLALKTAGKAAGFRAGLRDGATIAFPRTLLNQILNHNEPDLALRFVPRDQALPTRTLAARCDAPLEQEKRPTMVRLGLIQKLLVHMAPVVLMAVTLASGVLTCLGVLYALYAFGVWLFAPSVEPGWLTISAMLSLTASFLGAAIFGLSVGLQHIIGLIRPNIADAVVQEVNRIDLFGQVASELNVDSDHSVG